MSIKLELPRENHLRPRITVVGVGGAGSNAVNTMIANRLDRVSHGDTVCSSWASCITSLGEKKQIAYQGVTGRRS